MTIDDAVKCARERVEESRDMYACLLETSYQYQMKHKEEMDNYKKCEEEHEQLAEWLNELKKYKDAEEQGLLIKLPCKVGDTVYELQKIRKRIQPLEIVCLRQGRMGELYFSWELKDGIGIYQNVRGFGVSEIGKNVFLTKEEAEQKLKEMERDTNGN